jgi:hypothetical protein
MVRSQTDSRNREVNYAIRLQWRASALALLQAAAAAAAGQALALQLLALSQALLAVLSLAEAASLLAIFFWLPLLKSVSYQPLPLSRNPTAEISFVSSGWLQLGQSLSSGSLNFCKTSSS